MSGEVEESRKENARNVKENGERLFGVVGDQGKDFDVAKVLPWLKESKFNQTG